MKALKLIPLALMLSALLAAAQNTTNPKPAEQQKPAATDTKPQPGAFTLGAAPSPAPKRAPQAKSKPEFDAYAALIAMKDAGAMEKAADDFVTKYPDSELKGAVYQRVMATYQQADNDEKTLEMGRKSLTFNPDDPGVLVGLSDILIQKTRETDLDKDERLAEATKYAKHAIETIPDYPAPANMPPEQVASVKTELTSASYAAIGAAAYTNKKYADAETNFKQAIEVTKANPDPATMIRLVLTLDKEAKYPEALELANKILAMSNLDPRIQQFAQQEKDRLSKLTAPAAPKPATPTTSVPK